MFKLTLDPRKIREDDFPATASTAEKLKFLLNYAVLAPSSHNTQPWKFKLVNNAIELYADKTRALAIADPDGRELTISCGAALFHLRIAMRHFGYGDIVEILPEQNNPHLLARICLGSKRITKLEENFLFRAIPRRCTNRFSFDECQLPGSLISELESATSAEGSWLEIKTQVIPEVHRQTVINLIAQGDRLQMADPLFRRELAQWIRSGNNPKHDGIPAYAQGLDARFDAIAPLIAFTVRSFDLGKTQSDKDCQLAEQAPVLMLIGSQDDCPQAWIDTGEALAHLLLRARVDDVWASFFNQPIQIPQLRSRLRALFPHNGYPQILLRLGYAQEAQPTPRRSVDEVLNEVGIGSKGAEIGEIGR
ncbi:MAG: nitroreductase family protein [Pleurocapsa sp. MO_226.B13]|nr:nitroreductase family protein [Pleurocapsa sp. MO_226.B13]